MVKQQILTAWNCLNKSERVGELGITPSKLCGDDFIQTLWSEYRQRLGSLCQVIAGQNTHQAQVMITVKVGNENMADPGRFDFELPHLDLCAFTTVYQ